MNTEVEGGEMPRDAGSPPGLRGATDPTALLDDARLDDAARRRRRRRWRDDLDLERTSITGALLGALAHGHTVAISTTAGSSASGAVELVGADVVALVAGGRRTWCSLGAISAVETDGPLRGDPADRSDHTLAELLDEHVHDDELTVTTCGASVFRGRVIAVGDSLVLRAQAPARDVVVALDQICAVSLATTR